MKFPRNGSVITLDKIIMRLVEIWDSLVLPLFAPYLGSFGIILVIGSFGLMVFHGLVHFPAVSAEDWDSETFVKDLDELQNDQQLKQRGVEDPQWADYLSEIAPAYDEKGFPEVTTNDPADSFFSQKLNWSLTGRGEVPYLAVIYQFIEGEKEDDMGAMYGVMQHRACGGVLVSTERLITNCLCVATYFATNIYPNDEIAREGRQPDLPNDLGWKTKGKYLQNGKLNRIYVQFGANRYFTGPNMPGVKDPVNDRHLIDGTEKADDLPLLTKQQECGELAERAWFRGQRPANDEPIRNQLSNTLALVPFWEPIHHPAPGQFVPWPPLEFNDKATQEKLIKNPHTPLEQVIVTGMGFKKVTEAVNCRKWRLLDDEGEEIPLHKQAINLPYIHCTRRDDFTCKGKTIDDKYFKLSCFCDLYEPNTIGIFGCKTIGDGVYGWPVIFQGNVVALTASGRDPNLPGNPILGSSLAHPRLRDHVEKTLTKEKMLKQRTERPPMFREDLAGENYVFYDYPEQPQWFFHEGTTPKLIQLSLSEPFLPNPSTLIATSFISFFKYLTSLDGL